MQVLLFGIQFWNLYRQKCSSSSTFKLLEFVMSAQFGDDVFLSHSHKDKLVVANWRTG